MCFYMCHQLQSSLQAQHTHHYAVGRPVTQACRGLEADCPLWPECVCCCMAAGLAPELSQQPPPSAYQPSVTVLGDTLFGSLRPVHLQTRPLQPQPIQQQPVVSTRMLQRRQASQHQAMFCFSGLTLSRIMCNKGSTTKWLHTVQIRQSAAGMAFMLEVGRPSCTALPGTATGLSVHLHGLLGHQHCSCSCTAPQMPKQPIAAAGPWMERSGSRSISTSHRRSRGRPEACNAADRRWS